MSIRKKVLMSGDSWAFGSGRVFFDGNHHIFGLPATDTGIHMRDLFTEYEFTNYPFLGGHNIQSVEAIKNALSSEEFDYIFWVQTDPMRDIASVKPHKFNEPVVLTDSMIDLASSSNILQFMENKLTKTYLELDKVAADAGVKIHCVGGCSMLHHTISEFENLLPIMPSIIQFLIPTFTQDTIVFNTAWITGMIDYERTHTVNEVFSANLREIADIYHAKSTVAFGSEPYFICGSDREHPSPAGITCWTTECKTYIK